MRRRDFLLTASGALAGAPFLSLGRSARAAAPWLLVPMDEAQADHLKAYGLAFRLLERGGKGRVAPQLPGRLVPAARRTAPPMRDAALSGVTVETVDEAAVFRDPGGDSAQPTWTRCRSRRRRKVAVYAPPNAAPWDDAVTMALQYAGIKFDKIWDAGGASGDQAADATTGCICTTRTSPASTPSSSSPTPGAPWLTRWSTATSGWRGSSASRTCPAEKRAVADAISAFVDAGWLPLRDVHRHRDARPGAGERRASTSRPRYADGRRWTPAPPPRWTGAGPSRSRTPGWS